MQQTEAEELNDGVWSIVILCFFNTSCLYICVVSLKNEYKVRKINSTIKQSENKKNKKNID